MVCDETGCPNPATVTLYKDQGHEVVKVDVCTAHQYIYKQLGYKEAVLDGWTVDFEKLPTESYFTKLIAKIKRNK